MFNVLMHMSEQLVRDFERTLYDVIQHGYLRPQDCSVKKHLQDEKTDHQWFLFFLNL